MTLIRLFLLLIVCSLWAGCATEDSSHTSSSGLGGFLSRPVKLEGSY
jgi:Ca2+/H+ antiporter